MAKVPGDNGGRGGARWIALTDDAGRGLLVAAGGAGGGWALPPFVLIGHVASNTPY